MHCRHCTIKHDFTTELNVDAQSVWIDPVTFVCTPDRKDRTSFVMIVILTVAIRPLINNDEIHAYIMQDRLFIKEWSNVGRP